MKYLIIYDSKTGCTEDCAKYLHTNLDSADLLHVKQAKNVNLKDYDHVILGSPIYIGNPRKTIKKFYSNQDMITQSYSLFFCGASPSLKEVRDALSKSMPEAFLKDAKQIGFFGGDLRYDRMNFFEKMIMKKIEKENNIETKIDYSKVDEFIKSLGD